MINKSTKPGLRLIQGGSGEDTTPPPKRSIRKTRAAAVLAGGTIATGLVIGSLSPSTATKPQQEVVALVPADSKAKPLFKISLQNGGGDYQAIQQFALAEGDSLTDPKTTEAIAADNNVISGATNGNTTFYFHPVREIVDPSQLTANPTQVSITQVES